MQGSLHSSWALPNFDMVRHGISTTSTCAPIEEAPGARLMATSAAANAYTPPRPAHDTQRSTVRTKRPKSRKPQIDRSALHFHIDAAFRKLEEARLALIDVAAKAHYSAGPGFWDCKTYLFMAGPKLGNPGDPQTTSGWGP